MPGIKECRECNARSRRSAARSANRKRVQQREAEARAKAQADEKRAREEKKRRRNERLDRLTHDQVHSAFAEADGDRPAAERALGLERGELTRWMARSANREREMEVHAENKTPGGDGISPPPLARTRTGSGSPQA